MKFRWQGFAAGDRAGLRFLVRGTNFLNIELELMNSMRINVLASSVLAFCFVLSGQLYATVVTYDFTGSSSGLGTGNLGISSATVASGGLNVNVAAEDEFGSAGLLARNSDIGLGVVGVPGTGLQTNDVGADANGGEALVFDFSPNSVAIIDTIVFELGMEAGSLDVLADNVLLDTISWTAATGAGNTGNSDVTHTFTAPLAARTAQSFTFKAVADTFRLKSLTVDAVPEPTSVMLGLFGLVSIALTANRRRS